MSLFRACPEYHQNIKLHAGYYGDSYGFCFSDAPKECCDYIEYMKLFTPKGAPFSENRHYDEAQHEKCFKVPRLCEHTRAEDFTEANLKQNKEQAKEQLTLLNTYSNQEPNDFKYRGKKDSTKAKIEHVKSGIKALVDLYPEDGSDLDELLVLFEEDYCATHACDEEVVERFSLDSVDGGCSVARKENIVVREYLTDAVASFKSAVRAVCPGDILDCVADS